MWYGETYLEYCPGGQYTCPKYCKVDHFHLTGDCNEDKKKYQAYKQGFRESDQRDTLWVDGNTIASN